MPFTRTMFAALALAGLTVPLFAQETKPMNLSVRFGQFKPSFSDARAEDDQWFAFGLESRWRNLNVATSNPGTTQYLTFSFDTFSAGDFRCTPVLLNYVTRTNELYFTAGAGIAFGEEPDDSNQLRIGLQLGAGWDFMQGKTPLFVEAKYFFSTKNDHLNGFGMFVGVRL